MNAYQNAAEEKEYTALQTDIAALYQDWSENCLAKEVVLRPDLAGMRIFEMPVFGISDASDPMFASLKQKGIIGPWHRLPGDWLTDGNARRVISLFFPFSEQVKKEQRLQTTETTPEWLHARIEGHEALVRFTVSLKERIREMGFRAVVPILEPGFTVVTGGQEISGMEKLDPGYVGSTWSERHVAHISGLGTFGLSRGLITERGMAGRFCSIVTDMLLPVTKRPYERYDEWCTLCGACVRRCPVQAITLEHGKDHGPCGKRINDSKVRYAPRYGCGQCQTRVPCESKRP